jgi:enoyl-CoA hydratase
MSEHRHRYNTVAVEDAAPGVHLVSFNRPEVRNALSQEMVDELHDLLSVLRNNPETRALVFTGNEKVFLSGADISELRDRNRHDALKFINNSLFREIERFPWPTIAAVRGWALGGGCELAAACDLRVAGHGARFGQPEVKLGIIPGAGATYRLPRLIGIGNARDLVLTGRIIDGEAALAMGLANRLVDDDEVVPTAVSLAVEIAGNSSLAVRFAKLALNATHEMSTDAGFVFEATAQAVLFEDEEKRQRMTDFLERRKDKPRPA